MAPPYARSATASSASCTAASKPPVPTTRPPPGHTAPPHRRLTFKKLGYLTYPDDIFGSYTASTVQLGDAPAGQHDVDLPRGQPVPDFDGGVPAGVGHRELGAGAQVGGQVTHEEPVADLAGNVVVLERQHAEVDQILPVDACVRAGQHQ